MVGIAVVVLAVIAIAKRHAIEHGADELLTVVLIGAAITVAIAVAVVVAVMTLRVRQLAEVTRQNIAARNRATEIAQAATVTLRAAARPAIEPARPVWPHAPQIARDRNEVSR